MGEVILPILLLLGMGVCLLASGSMRKVSNDQGEVDMEYDRLINLLIDAGRIDLDTTHTVKAGKLRIWVANYPYAYGHPHDSGISERILPTTKTRKKLRDYVAKLSVLTAIERANASRAAQRGE